MRLLAPTLSFASVASLPDRALPQARQSSPAPIRLAVVDGFAIPESARFNTIPQPGEFGYDTWPKDASKYIGAVNTWGELSVDVARGIAYSRLLIASMAGQHLIDWTAATGLDVVATGPGGYDGIEALADGTIVVSSQDLPGVLALDGRSLRPLITPVSDTGDIGVDQKRQRIAIPRLDAHVVELWQLPR